MTIPTLSSDGSDVADGAVSSFTHEIADTVRRRPGRPSLADQAQTLDARAMILRQARLLFMQRGFADVSVGEVAQMAGVTKPTLYYHFQSKQGLYAAMLSDMMREVGGYIGEVIALALPVRERLRLLALGYFAHARTGMEPLLRDTIELIGQELASDVMAAYDVYMFTPILGLLTAGMASGEIAQQDPELLTRAYFGLIEAFTGADKFDRFTRTTDPAICPPTERHTRLASASSRSKAGTRETPRGAYPAHAQHGGSANYERLANLVVTLFLDGVGG